MVEFHREGSAINLANPSSFCHGLFLMLLNQNRWSSLLRESAVPNRPYMTLPLKVVNKSSFFVRKYMRLQIKALTKALYMQLYLRLNIFVHKKAVMLALISATAYVIMYESAFICAFICNRIYKRIQNCFY